MSTWHGSATIAVLIFGLTAFTSATQRNGAPQIFRVRTDLVQVDVSVLDKRRQPVRGLQAADFTLLEDGQPRPVAAFTAVELPAQSAAPKAPWVRGVPSDVSTNDFPDEGRLVVILMDRTIPFGLPAATAHNVAKTAIEQLSPGDLAAVVYTGAGTPQDFTSDRARLMAAIGEHAAAGVSRETSDRLVDQRDQLEAALWIDPPRPVGAPLISVPGFIPRTMPGENDGECYCGLCVLNSIRTVADALRDSQVRHKSLLFIGADIVMDTTNPQCESSVTATREAMFKSVDLANLTIHAFDANGLESNVVAPSSQGLGLDAPVSPRNGALTVTAAKSKQLLMRQGHLMVLPDLTGGRTVLNTNDPAGRVPEVFRESRSYYVLGFEPTKADGREHTISVKVNRRDVTVGSSRTYVAAPSAAAQGPSIDPARSALAHVIPQRHGITLSATALAVAVPGTHTPTLFVALHAQHDANKPAPEAPTETIEIATAVLSADGRSVGTFSQTVTTERSGAGLAYDVVQRIPAKPGRYELRIGVNDSLREQSGTVHAFVDIPAFNRTPFMWSAIGVSEPAVRPATTADFSDELPALPIARRDFDRQQHVTAFIGAYHTSGVLPAPISVVSHIVDEQNRQRFERTISLGASDFDASQKAVYRFDVPLGSLEPGSYLLKMDCTAGSTLTTRQIRFSVH